MMSFSESVRIPAVRGGRAARGGAAAPARGRGSAVRVSALWQKAEAEAKATAKAKKMAGFRYDGSMMRWIRDERIEWNKDQAMQTKAKPMSGSAYTVWPVVWQTLVDEGVKTVTCEQAESMMKKGWTLVDVRLEADYERQHAEGAINVPLYRPVQGTEFWDNVKKAVMSGFLAMQATERDPDYIETIQASLKKNQKVILMCAIGGTLEVGTKLRPDKYPNGNSDPDRNFGRESRGLKAAFEFLQAGWSGKNIVFVEGGLQQWRYQDFPMEGLDYE